MQAIWSDFFVAAHGTFKVNNIIENVLDFDGFHVPVGAVVTSLKVNGEATNVLTDYIASGGTFEANDIVTAMDGDYFSAITLSSGAVTCIKKDPTP